MPKKIGPDKTIVRWTWQYTWHYFFITLHYKLSNKQGNKNAGLISLSSMF